MQNLICNQRFVGPESFQGYLSRPINIYTVHGNYNVFPVHVDGQNLYCVETGPLGQQLVVPLGDITSIKCA